MGHLNPKVNEVYVLKDAVQAIEQLAMRKAIGKLVIQVNSAIK
jgi:NADPH:quinone reductase-like Zn-dependent oxidoreductase